ncbi:OPI3 (YJR073C) [Zygosaccharomyces parabailii]|uniref:Phosphatidyl-N-methylethanolamine N-methyltransferase n=1 Tax=Zygosaccharomyces bailii (strain CLIB 213 / ATCC 58445 / CBS 680 / BCRC 21525 / NBRC 1098 / NCYC 1416 / NRRL Y-2227) TaxID=1333698 RepID=A0A8J2X6R4_ZYGB2|nr:OPI3 (YJR073C) [Zygosaccharomyces parabailii]CDF88689.1 BN860_16138g1_1 [Zygosaccharomyces bailii CLIB 213]CDH13236.1 probable Methylene-fatty-acyl-phospholipid synthase [Zygosaccharomyces bailii ISA1307]SJM82543.1 probable Phosphatidyl-N-methylethanolamine N-methyltransferase [Zygosaccharomyces bailii]
MDFKESFRGIRSAYMELFHDVDLEEPSFSTAMYFIIFNPTFWNIAARLEYHTHFLTKITGSAKKGCYLLAATIFTLGVGRDLCFHKALDAQPLSPVLDNPKVKFVGQALVIAGQVLVGTSMWQLGITGTYLGDYFGILMDHIVTSFPFNVCNNPMYQGSTLSFLGYSLVTGKAAGLILAFMVYAMYSFALRFEEPFTAKIYAERDDARSRKNE